MCWDWPVSGPCWPAVSSLTGQSCGRLWSPRAWPALDWRPLLYMYPSYRRQHWKITTNSKHFFKLIISSNLVLFYKCVLNQNCYRSLHLSAVGLGVNYVYFTIMISKNRLKAANVLLFNLDWPLVTKSTDLHITYRLWQ